MDERSRAIQRRFEWPLLAFALLTIPAIAIEYGDTGQPWQTIGTVLNWTIWLAFVLEFVVMLWVVPDRWLWIRKNPLDLAIVVLTPPFLPESLQAARVFRLFLLLRLAKAGVLVRHLLSTEGIRDAAVRPWLPSWAAARPSRPREGTRPERLGRRVVGHDDGDHCGLRKA